MLLNKITAAVKIIRPLNVFLSIVSLLICAFLLDMFSEVGIFLISCVVVGTFTAGGNILNDLFDLSIDKINRPNRPLPSGKVKIIEAVFLSIILFCIGITTTFFLPNLAQQIALFIVLPLLILYTPVFKRLPLIGNIIIAAILGMVFLFGEAALSGAVNKMWIPFFLAFGLTLIREFVKDMQDLDGDAQNQINTFPVKYGMNVSIIIFIFFCFLLCAGSLIPYFYYQYGVWYLVILIIGVELPLIYSVIHLWNNRNSAASGKIAGLLKFTTIAGMTAILLSKI